jgi:hypothetical protein
MACQGFPKSSKLYWFSVWYSIYGHTSSECTLCGVGWCCNTGGSARRAVLLRQKTRAWPRAVCVTAYCVSWTVCKHSSTMIPRLTKIIRSWITFVSRNAISHRLSGVSLLAVSNVNKPVGLVGLPCVMWSAHFFVTHIQTEKISCWNGPTVHVCCVMLARASTKTFVSRIHIR